MGRTSGGPESPRAGLHLVAVRFTSRLTAKHFGNSPLLMIKIGGLQGSKFTAVNNERAWHVLWNESSYRRKPLLVVGILKQLGPGMVSISHPAWSGPPPALTATGTSVV